MQISAQIKMRILVTGGTGFIGKHLVERLDHKLNEVLLLSRNPQDFSSLESENVKLMQGDLSNIDTWKHKVKEFSPHAAIHLAWEGIPDYRSVTSIKNLNHGLSLYSILIESGCKKIISTGSCWEYGKQTGCLNESQVIHPHNAFASAKNSLHWAGKYLSEENGIDFAWLRLFYVYGPNQRKDALIPYIIRCIKENTKPEIKTPSAKNDFVYVGDVADAIIAVLQHDTPNLRSSVYNVGSGNLTGVKEIIHQVYTHLNITPEVTFLEDKAEVLYDGSWADLIKIREDTGWKPAVSISEGILRMMTMSERSEYDV